METCADRARLALLIAHYESTREFTDPGEMAVLLWYEEFCASKGKNVTEPLNLFGMDLKSLPTWVTLPLSFGIPYVKLAGNPDLTDITSLQAMPILTKLGTIEHAMDTANSPELALALGEIREVLLSTKHCIKLPLKGLKSIPVYIQLLSDIESINLEDAYDIKNLKPIRNFRNLRRLYLNRIDFVPNLKDLINLPVITSLYISRSCQQGILEGIDNLPYLKKISISWSRMMDLEPLKKLSELEDLYLSSCYKLQTLRLGSELPNLQKLYVSFLRELRELAIDHPCDSLKSLTIRGGGNLEAITGINLLSNLEELDLSMIDNLQNIAGMESVQSLKKITIGSLAPSLIKSVLKVQIASGKYRSFRPNGTEIDLEHDSFPEEKPIKVILLAHEMATLAAPTTLSRPQPNLPIALNHCAVTEQSLRSLPGMETLR